MDTQEKSQLVRSSLTHIGFPQMYDEVIEEASHGGSKYHIIVGSECIDQSSESSLVSYNVILTDLFDSLEWEPGEYEGMSIEKTTGTVLVQYDMIYKGPLGDSVLPAGVYEKEIIRANPYPDYYLIVIIIKGDTTITGIIEDITIYSNDHAMSATYADLDNSES